MLPYVLLAVASFALALLAAAWRRQTARTGWNAFDVLCVALLVAFSGLRSDVGTDFSAYQISFDRLDPQYDWWEQAQYYGQDLGYTYLALFVKTLTDSPNAIFWATSALAIVPVYAALRKQSRDLPLAIVLYILLCFYVAPFNIIRQGIAVALVFWAYSCLNGQKRRLLVFAVIAAVATTFHPTAVVVATIMLVARIWKPGRWGIIALLGGSAAISGVVWTVPAVRGLLDALNARYGNYVDASDSPGTTAYVMVVVFLALALVAAIAGENGRSDWMTLLLIGVAFLIISTQSPVALRMFNYFGPFVLLLLPNALAAKPGNGPVRVGVVVAAAVYFTVYVSLFADLVPYQTYL